MGDVYFPKYNNSTEKEFDIRWSLLFWTVYHFFLNFKIVEHSIYVKFWPLT